MMEESERIQALIADNKILEACTALKQLTNDTGILDQILSQEAQYNGYTVDVRIGAKSDDQNTKTLNRIIASVIQIANNVKRETLNRNGQKLEGKQASTVTDSKANSQKEEIDSLIEDAEDYYNATISIIGGNKRDVYDYCTYTLSRYKVIPYKYPDLSFPYLRIAQTLKIMYLLNYNNSRNEENLQEIMSNVKQGKIVDTKKRYQHSFDLIPFDIKEYIRKSCLMKAAFIISIPAIVLLFLDAENAQYLVNKHEETGMIPFVPFALLLTYALSLSESLRKHIKSN